MSKAVHLKRYFLPGIEFIDEEVNEMKEGYLMAFHWEKVDSLKLMKED